jgi:L-threonylcarbamoyladenylate synthase
VIVLYLLTFCFDWICTNRTGLEKRLLPSARISRISDPGAIDEAAQIIRSGGIVAFPTETVYGLGADARNPLAVARIFEVKARPRIDPIIVHVADQEAAGLYGTFPKLAQVLADRFWPGPLTLILRKSPLVPPIVTAGLETVAIRVPAHSAALALIKASGCGIAAPSANPFGYVSPTEAQHVAEQLSDRIDMILDGGPSQIGVESTILSLVGDVPSVLRAGGTPIEELESVVGKLRIEIGSSFSPQAPGQLQRHYATQTRLEILEKLEGFDIDERVGLLSLMPPTDTSGYAAIEILSANGDLREAASNLFRALRRLDNLSLDRIVVLPVPEEGLGVAIMDRLRRCSARK